MNRGGGGGVPDERGEARCHRRYSQAAARPCRRRSRLTGPAHFYFPFINSGRLTAATEESGDEGRKEEAATAARTEIRSCVFCNYPTLLKMIITSLRVWNVFGPQSFNPRLYFSKDVAFSAEWHVPCTSCHSATSLPPVQLTADSCSRWLAK